MPVLRIPTPLRPYTNGQSEVRVRGSNILDALNDLTTQFPAIRPHLFNEGGQLRPFVNLFVGENNIKDLQGVDTPIQDGDRLVLIPSIAGGCRCEEGVLSEVAPCRRSRASGGAARSKDPGHSISQNEEIASLRALAMTLAEAR